MISESRPCTNGELSLWQLPLLDLQYDDAGSMPVTTAMLVAFVLLMGWWVRRRPGQGCLTSLCRRAQR